jgi:hypothetical protein
MRGRSALAIGALALVLVLGAVRGARAADSVEELYIKCITDVSIVRQQCLWYVAGVSDLLRANGAAFRRERNILARYTLQPVSICEPEKANAPYAAKVQVFVRWAARNPREWQNEAEQGVVLALREAWPCLPP